MELLYLTIFSIVLTLFFIGFFAGMEIAFITANKLNIELKKKQGKQSGVIMSAFMMEPEKFIGSCLIGVNLFLVAYGLLFSSLLHPAWLFLGIKNSYVHLVVDTLLSTCIVLIFGEFIPKAIFRAKNDALLSLFAIPANFFYKIFYPFAAILVHISQWILKYVLNIRVSNKNEAFGKVDLEYFFKQNKDQEEENKDLNTELFENALSLSMIKIRQCLIPRTEIEAFEITTPIWVIRQHMIETKLSKLVIYDQAIDNIIGYVHQLDMFKNPIDINAILIPIPVVPESMSATDLINKFSKERKSIAWVIDEFGGTAGIVTMEDILEEIFGEIKDEHDSEEFIERILGDNEYIFSGRLETDYIHQKYGLTFSVSGSETLSGFIISKYESIPQQKQRIIIDMFEFEILEVSDTRIEMVKMRVLN